MVSFAPVTKVVACAAFVSAAMALAQTDVPYQPSVPAAPSTSYGGYGFYGGTPGGGTVEGSMMQGMASVISSAGNYNLATSAAAVNLSQALKQEIKNNVAATNAYFEMKETNRAYTKSHTPRLSQEQLVRLAATAAPQPLSGTEIDYVNGKVAWPKLLQRDEFQNDRATIEKLLAKQASYGRLGQADDEQLSDAIERMSATLRNEIKNASANEYISGKNFLKSLMYGLYKKQLS